MSAAEAADEASVEERAAIATVLGEAGVGAAAAPAGRSVVRPGRPDDGRTHLLPCLRELQRRVGGVRPGAVRELSARLGLAPAEIFGVASFYALLETNAPEAVTVHVCDDVVCRLRGGDALRAALTAGGHAAVHPSPCLGQCDRAPAALVARAGRDGGWTTVAPAEEVTVRAVMAGAAAPLPAPARIGASARGPVLARVGRVEPESVDSYRAHGGYRALRRALALGPEGICLSLERAGLTGRGGAGFPTAAKWRAVAARPERPHYVVANGDESEPGTFKDRVLLEEDPFSVVEGLTIAAIAAGAERGYIYVRGEYPLAAARLVRAAQAARARGLLGDDILGRGVSFDLEVRVGAGAYVCGEETALLNSIEGHPGEPRNKPPFPAVSGLFGLPTAVNNIETLAHAVAIVADGVEAFRARGTADAPGTRLFAVSGAVRSPGVYELGHGARLGELIEAAGGVPEPGRLRAVLLGGAAGTFVGPEAVDLVLTPAASRAAGASLGSGAVVVFADRDDLAGTVLRVARFFRDESCGQCVPCRIGSVRQEEMVARLVAGRPLGGYAAERERFRSLAAAMRDASICGLGQTAPAAVESALRLGILGGEG